MSNKLRFFNIFDELTHVVLDWIYPRFCIGCEKQLQYPIQNYICSYCISDVPWIVGPQCMGCGKPNPTLNQKNFCELCKDETTWLWKRCFCFVKNEGIAKNIILEAKYSEMPYLIQNLFTLQAQKIFNILKFLDIDWIVPVPLSPARQKDRGYNQSALIAEKLSQLIQIPVSNQLLKKIKWTPPQATQGRLARLQNLKESFKASLNSRIKFPVRVLLVDDIMTTGSTLTACAQALYDIGIQEIYTFCLARSI